MLKRHAVVADRVVVVALLAGPMPKSVLDGEILPVGWTFPEGHFGEFTRLMGGLHWNPLVRITAISMRKDAIYYNLRMPWENTWLGAPTRYAAIRSALRTAGVQVKDINVTLGGCAFWHAVISIKPARGRRFYFSRWRWRWLVRSAGCCGGRHRR